MKTRNRTKPDRPKLTAIIEVLFRGKWTELYRVTDWAAEKNWNMNISEAICQIRVRYL